MTSRTAAALCAALVVVGTARAQPAAADGPPPPAAPAAPAAPIALPPAAPAVVADGGEWWASAELLLAWFNQTRIPALVTSSPAGTARGVAGVLGQPGTAVLFGGSVNDTARPGLRLGVGYSSGVEYGFGAELGGSVLESRSTFFAASSDRTAILARPFVNVLAGNVPQAVLVAFPGSSTGAVRAQVSAGNLYELHLDVSENLILSGRFRADVLVGYRFYRYDEGLGIRQSITSTDPAFAVGTMVESRDDFSTQNEFHGGEIGARGVFAFGDLSVGLLGKIAVGGLRQQVLISGSQTTTAPGAAPVSAAGGVLALSSNSGRHTRSDWALFPEFGGSLAWQLSPSWRLRAGYTTFLLHRIARAPHQIDFGLNPNLFPPPRVGGPARPAFTFNRSDVWVQNLSFGVEYSF